MNDKEKNKLIERTSKRDAYAAVYSWAKRMPKALDHGSAAWFAKVKMDGHSKWLKEQPYEYDYVTSTFIKKENV